MVYALNTNVNGSSGTCVKAADWLAKLGREAAEAGKLIGRARSTAESGWHGEAHDRFTTVTSGLNPHLDEIVDVAKAYERALRDFAGTLDAINAKMDDALAKAKTGGLEVQGPFILGPERPAPPTLALVPQVADQMEEYLKDADGAKSRYNDKLLAYNAKVGVYNACKAIVDSARNQEENAHDELRQAMTREADGDRHHMRNAFTILAFARSTIGGAENPRRLDAAKGERLLAQSRFMKDFALGTVASTNPAQGRILERSATLANDGGKHLTRARQFERWAKMFPEDVRRKLTAYPGQKAAENLAAHSTSAKLPTWAGRTVRAVPYVGAILTVANEGMGAASGEKAWDRAAADAGATIVGGALGGAATGAIAGSAFGPPGAIVLGLVGGISGAIFAQDVVAGIYGEGK